MSKKLKCPKNEFIRKFLISTMLLIFANMNAQTIEFKDNAFKKKLVDPLNSVAKNLKGESFKIDEKQ